MRFQDEFDDFFSAHYDQLVGSLTAITGDREVATDCVQEAFIQAFARWNRIRRYDKPVTWVRRVAINRSRDAHRSSSRRRRREDRFSHHPLPPVPSPAEQVGSNLDLVQLLNKLSPRQRSVAALFYVEDLSIAEIADSLGLSGGTVKFHLNKARQSLQALLETEEAAHV
jgi:RNA polymerase sigma-70 factor (ECF subfamily)